LDNQVSKTFQQWALEHTHSNPTKSKSLSFAKSNKLYTGFPTSWVSL